MWTGADSKRGGAVAAGWAETVPCTRLEDSLDGKHRLAEEVGAQIFKFSTSDRFRAKGRGKEGWASKNHSRYRGGTTGSGGWRRRLDVLLRKGGSQPGGTLPPAPQSTEAVLLRVGIVQCGTQQVGLTAAVAWLYLKTGRGEWHTGLFLAGSTPLRRGRSSATRADA